MFVDASALVAILAEEPEGEDLAARIEQAERLVTSPIAIFETLAALIRKKSRDIEDLRRDLQAFLRRARIEVLSISEEAGYAAADAHGKLGKRSGHPARLNMGDCFAYAMAKQHRVPLLYKGDDFSKTDLA
jgi:ribonuclease VapC